MLPKRRQNSMGTTLRSRRPVESSASLFLETRNWNLKGRLQIQKVNQCFSVGRDSSVGIATRYGLDGPGTESRRGRDFPHPPRPALRPTQPPIQWVPCLFPRG